jgi:hypothetical protein
MQWLKDINGKWYIPTNDIIYSDFKENLKKTSDLNIVVSASTTNSTSECGCGCTLISGVNTVSTKAVIYIPTHNIHDAYEWFRIFKDSHNVSNVFDKYGFAIHGYFDKSRGESRKGWFPNLVEVKASSSSEYKYYTGMFGQYRSSIDYIENFTNIPQLFIDGVEVFNEELVLLKNQSYEYAGAFSVSSSIDRKYTILIGTGDEQYFNIGDKCFMVDTNGNYFYDEIELLEFPVSFIMVVTLKNTVITNATNFGSMENTGQWFINTFDNQNGVYQYFEKNLIAISEMSDKYKTYGQIVYTYQGLTNQNKEFYLRRIEDTMMPSYGQYPTINSLWPLNYSDGEAYLIKCEVDYNLDPEDPKYPTTNPPYSQIDNAYRLLFLDNTMSDKILSADADGIGTYKTIETYNVGADSDIMLGTKHTTGSLSAGFDDLSFDNVDVNSKTNILHSYNIDRYFGSPVLPNYTFIHKIIVAPDGYNNTWTTNINTVTLTQNPNTTTISAAYLGGFVSKFPITTFAVGDFINLQFSFYDDNTGIITEVLHEQFVVVSSTVNVSGITVEFFPPLDAEFLNEFDSFSMSPNYVAVNVDAVNSYGTYDADYTAGKNTSLLNAALNKTIIGKIYDFTYYEKTGFPETWLKLNKIRQSHKYKWDNHGTNITAGPLALTYAIDHAWDINRRIYFKGYNTIQDYIQYYLNCCQFTNIDLAQMQDVPVIYNNSLNAPTRFGVEGSNKIPGAGNLILFGESYKELFLDNIKKDTVVTLTPALSLPTTFWVSKIEWNEEDNLGTITTLNYITSPLTSEACTISTERDIATISAWLYDVFNKDINQTINPNTMIPYTWHAHKPDTASYAYAMLNYAYDSSTVNKNTELLSNLTAIVYKEFNEPRMSFLKRDKQFIFNNNATNVDAASTGNVNIASAPGAIDGVSLNVGNLVILKDQTIITENFVYVFNGAGNALVPYGSVNNNDHWFVTGGTINGFRTYKSTISQITVPIVKPPFFALVDVVNFQPVNTSNMDPRLTLKPIEIAKLGDDNLTQPWKKINMKYDSIEYSENFLNIQIGINNRRRIRFIDGLSENKIINNIDGQGQYAWILDEDVIVDDAVVGCTQISGPGTGLLVWYTGTWEQGVWCNGIWISGTWVSGTWLNGTFNANEILDSYYYVTYSNIQDNVLSIWQNGAWTQGTWNGGIAYNITWLDGTFNGGVINDGTWAKGTFNGGTINHIIWSDGLFTGGDFETGIWYTGQLIQSSPANPARFGTKADGLSPNFEDKAIWYSGIFDGGQFWSGLNFYSGIDHPSVNHQGGIWYSGEFRSGDFWGGSFITGVFKNSIWHDGVWFGGYYATSITDLPGNDKRITIDPAQYDDILGLADDANYLPNNEHRMHKYYQTAFQMAATPTTLDAFSEIAFINQWDINNIGTYPDLLYAPNSGTDTTIDLTITSISAGLATYQVANPSLNQIDGRPFIYAVFKNATWKQGIWLNGYFSSSIWEQGSWVDGYLTDSVFGINSF